MATAKLDDYRLTLMDGRAVRAVLADEELNVIQLVRETYLAHENGRTINPSSHFLRFPDPSRDRIIALPAYLDGPVQAAGLKWISSFPSNVDHGHARASSVIVLNDVESGYPTAVLEASAISSARTAASAALAVKVLATGDIDILGIVGAGLISRETIRYLAASGITPDTVLVTDKEPNRAAAFIEQSGRLLPDAQFEARAMQETIAQSDLVVFATVAGEPHVSDPALFVHHPLVLHLSLRDLHPDVIMQSLNITDDAGHVMQANTSLQLAADKYPDTFVSPTTIGSVLGSSTPQLSTDATTIFSPFGLGSLDIALASAVIERGKVTGRCTSIADFFSDETVPRSPQEVGSAT